MNPALPPERQLLASILDEAHILLWTAKVHLAFVRAGFLPYAEDVIADSTQVVEAPLTAGPRVTTAGVGHAARPPRPAQVKGPAGMRPKVDLSNESTLPVNF